MHNINQIELLDSSPAAPRRPPPLLALEIVLAEGNELAFSTSLDTLTPRILTVFDKSIACTLVGLFQLLCTQASSKPPSEFAQINVVLLVQACVCDSVNSLGRFLKQPSAFAGSA